MGFLSEHASDMARPQLPQLMAACGVLHAAHGDRQLASADNKNNGLANGGAISPDAFLQMLTGGGDLPFTAEEAATALRYDIPGVWM